MHFSRENLTKNRFFKFGHHPIKIIFNFVHNLNINLTS